MTLLSQTKKETKPAKKKDPITGIMDATGAPDSGTGAGAWASWADAIAIRAATRKTAKIFFPARPIFEIGGDE